VRHDPEAVGIDVVHDHLVDDEALAACDKTLHEERRPDARADEHELHEVTYG
jgi:hypothetical protein